jgi:hypothetical protein
MTVIASSPEPFLEPLDWDNGQPEHTYDWDGLTMNTLFPCPKFFCLPTFIAHVCTLNMAEDELSAYSVFSNGMSWAV